MYTKNTPTKTALQVCKSYTGETIEAKVRRIVNNKEPIKDGAPIIYTERKEGVLPGYDIRTDRFEIALEKMDAAARSHVAKRQGSIGEKAKENMEKEQSNESKKDGGAEPTATTGADTSK